ncbi:hypothetical protein V8F20_009043 [Naviculisporaceae sp. PSN 640]
MSSRASFNYAGAFAANCAFIALPIIPLLTFWAIALKRIYPKTVSPPLRIALLSLRIAPPIYAVGMILEIVKPAIVAIINANDNGPFDYNSPLYEAWLESFLVNLSGYFCTMLGTILLNMVLYLATVGTLYTVRGRMTWWKFYRVDAPLGAVFLMVCATAWYGQRMTVLGDPENWGMVDGWIDWLAFIVDSTMALLAAICLATMTYTLVKLSRREFEGLKGAMGKAPTQLLVASVLWFIRACYGTADSIKFVDDEYLHLESDAESQAQLFIYPIMQHWLVTAVVGLLVFAVRNSIWSDASIQPTTSNPVIVGPDQQHYQQQPLEYYPAPGQQIPLVQQQHPGQQPIQDMYPTPEQQRPLQQEQKY